MVSLKKTIFHLLP